MPQYSFGTGSLYGVSTNVANATPIRFGGLQDCQIDFTFTEKELYSSYQFPVAIGRGTAKIAGKATFAQFNALILNDLFFNEAAEAATGQNLVAIDENHTIPATPYQVTVTNSAQYTTDLGVKYAATGLPLIKVASSPATGQYSVAAGVYTFAAADTTMGVNISYVYTSASSGKTITITNQLLGSAAFFQAVFTEVYQGKTMTLTLNQCMSSKFTLPYKLEDFTLADFEFGAFADASNTIGTITMAE